MLEIRKTRFGQKSSINERNRRRKLWIRIVVFVVVLIFIFVIAGMVYAWYASQNPEERVISTPVNIPKTKVQTYEPSPDAPVAIVMQSLTTPIKAGGTAMMTIKTNPKAVCQITAKMGGSVYPDTGLIPKTADEYGVVGWSWAIPGNAPASTWPIEVTCANEAKKSAYYKAELAVVL